jgi:hypothetical protein
MPDTKPSRERHPDLFDEAEAVDYLHLPADTGPRTLETLRDKGLLVGHRVGKHLVYWRDDLNACALRIVGRGENRTETGPRLKMAGR